MWSLPTAMADQSIAPVEVRRLYDEVTVATEVAVALIVSENEYDVGPFEHQIWTSSSIGGRDIPRASYAWAVRIVQLPSPRVHRHAAFGNCRL